MTRKNAKHHKGTVSTKTTKQARGSLARRLRVSPADLEAWRRVERALSRRCGGADAV